MFVLMFMRHTLRMTTMLVLAHALKRTLRHAWRAGFDEHDARHQLEARARRLFNAIMTERYAECLTPITLRRESS